MLRLMQIPAMAILCGAALAGCGRPPATPVAGGDAARGGQLIARLDCGACHSIPGVRGADGRVGPPLDGIARRTIIAGMLPNTPDNLMRWLRNPQGVVPGNAMPDTGLDAAGARDVAAYLYTLQ
jgi:cytochrome c2